MEKKVIVPQPPFLFFLTDFYLACFKDYVSRLSKKSNEEHMILDQRLPGKCTKQKKCFSPKTKKKRGKKITG
jgi:hypothetical protein